MNKIVELLIDFEETPYDDLGVNIMSLVDQPAIGVNWLAFAQQDFVKPKDGEEADPFMDRCIPVLIDEGYPQDQAAAICHSYWEEVHGPTEMGVDTGNLQPYVEQVSKPKKKGFESCTDEELQRAILKEAETLGEEYDPREAIYLQLNRDEFTTVGEVLEGIVALDILGKRDIARDQRAETKYRYAGPPGQRFFCRGMMRLNKLYTREEINEITRRTASLNPGMGHNSSTYSVWNYKGGVNCQHYWEELHVFRNANGQLVMVSNGPAPGDAGEVASASNNYWRFKADGDQMIITGPAMIPNQLIPRKDEMGNIFHVFFSKETVAKIAREFLAREYAHNTDINHNEIVTKDNTLLESWLVDNPQMDKASDLGFSVPTGTWMVSYKVNDPTTWERIKAGELNGFSVAGEFIQKLAK